MLQNCCCNGKLISIMLYICDVQKNSIEQLKGKIKESITLEEFHLVEKIHQKLYKKSFQQKRDGCRNLVLIS